MMIHYLYFSFKKSCTIENENKFFVSLILPEHSHGLTHFQLVSLRMKLIESRMPAGYISGHPAVNQLPLRCLIHPYCYIKFNADD